MSGGRAKSKELTMREQQERMELVNSEKRRITGWEVFRYPTLLKPVKSIGQLQKKVAEYMAQFETIVVSDTKKDGKGREYDRVTDTNLPTVGGLAKFLGYPSARSLYKEIREPSISTDPRYYLILERAVDSIEDLYEKRMLHLGETKQDFRAYTEVLKRHDEERSKMEEAAEIGNINNKGGTININFYKGFEKEMENRVDALIKNLTTPQIQEEEVIDITEVEEVEGGEDDAE